VIFAINTENRVAIAQAGGIVAVVDAMKQHTTHDDVQEYGCGVLFNLAGGSAENRVTIAEVGVIAAIVDALN